MRHFHPHYPFPPGSKHGERLPGRKLLSVLTLILLTGTLAHADRVLLPEVSETESAPAPRDPAIAVFEIGVWIGQVEQGTRLGTKPKTLVAQLIRIREQLEDTGSLVSPKEIDALIEAMGSAKESRDLHDRIVAFRKTIAARVAGKDEPVMEEVPFDCDQGSWEGVWTTTWGDMTLVFEKDGRFHGTYGSSQHAVSGEFDPENPKVLRGQWDHFGSTAAAGGIRFEMKAPNRFEGGWSSEIPVDGAGSGWSGTRRKTHHSEILIVPVGEATIAKAEETWSQSFLVRKGFSVHGRNVDFPLLRIYTQSPETGEWENSGSGDWESLPSIEEVGVGDNLTIDVVLLEALASRHFVIEFGRKAIIDDEEQILSLRTRPLRMVPPKVNESPGTGDAFLPETIDAPDGDGEVPSEGETVPDSPGPP